MWILTSRGFYSATETFEDAEMLQVRARDKQDLENLRVFVGPSMRILHTPDRDYEWRILITKDEWAEIVSTLTLDISYNNFKDEVTKVQGHKRHDIYMAVWTTLGRIGKPYRGWSGSPRNEWKRPSFKDAHERPWERDGITKEEWDAQTDSFLDLAGTVEGDYDGRSPVPNHWMSAKKKTRRGKRGGRNRNTTDTPDESGFDSDRLPISFHDDDH